ncbi:MAG: hypothetical protein ABR548_12150, partial [Actinomycetota bacterium]
AFDQNRQETERRVEAQTQQSAAVSARIKAALETLGTQMTQITQRLESLGDVQQVAQGIHGEVAALSSAIPKQIAAAVEEAARPLSESVIAAGERVGGLSESLGAIRDRLETLPSPDHLAAALREERDAAERRSEALGQQVAAVVGSLISSIGELRSHVETLSERPDVPLELKEELTHLTNTAAASAASGVDALRTSLTESIGSIRAAVNESTEAARAKVEEDAASIRSYFFEGATALRAHIDESAEAERKAFEEIGQKLLAQATSGAKSAAAAADQVSKLGGLGDQVSDLLRAEREATEQRAQVADEQSKTLSASVGAIYLRVRSLEQSIAELKASANRDMDDNRSEIAAVGERLAEMTELERRLAKQMAAIDTIVRERKAEKERDQEIMSLLAELAEASGKDRARLGERLRGILDRGQRHEAPEVVPAEAEPPAKNAAAKKPAKPAVEAD